MGTNNLNLAQLATNQASPEVTVNDANAQLDAAITEILTFDLTVADAAPTLTQFRESCFAKVTGASGAFATGTLTNDGTNVSDLETVTVGGKVYTFHNSLAGAVDGDVKIGASNTASMTNLFNAINANGGGVSGTDYASAMTPNTKVTATNPTGTTVVVTAITAGTAGNAIASTETSAHLSWGAATLTGGTQGGGVTLPATKKSFYTVEADAANTIAVSLAVGTSLVKLTPGRLYAVRTDGTANGLVVRDIGGQSTPNDMHVFVPGVMANGQLLYFMKVTRAFTLAATLPGSYATAQAAATGSTTVTIKRNGVSVGTIVWSASGTIATFTFPQPVTWAIGDTFSLTGPATADATLADASFDLFGSR